jgi:S-adenosylmethionine:tRNA ribosyltransferase-isomerase
MVLDRQTGKRSHNMVSELHEILCRPEFLSSSGKKPLLVFNDSKVRKARLVGTSLVSDAQVDFLLLEETGNRELGTGNGSSNWKVLVNRGRRKKPGQKFVFYDKAGQEIANAEISGGEGEFRFLEFDRPISEEWLDKYGHIPLPPYIKRKDSPLDAERYQTVYAGATGSAAAPTAGLHFTKELLASLSAAGIELAFITLHVGLGTFLPVRTETIEEHRMHEERFVITGENAGMIEKAKAEGRKIIAVGTTSVRTLESAWTQEGKLKSGWQSTSIFIYPGYKFMAVDSLFTNFHTPGSTLLMLVSAFRGRAGRELIMESYAEAILNRYRFFSYGDAMLIV